ncbi:hypothetical protein A3L14_04970 [Thermococcus thioreducens]|uniref:Class III signal peptide n=2 Tax=Thermococcus thioreducens TaxID=277988 RepID=A0A0Q2UQS6_9EURY|nr:hypothetical protein A3L14_04970 [Thermococcus thioreducens]KQH83016.1 hypothetical protein AMR53_01965 [Thermococcus thioreducens]
MNRNAQASLEYIMMFAVGMLIAAIIIYRLIGIKGLAKWAGSQMNSTGKEITEGFQNLSNISNQ